MEKKIINEVTRIQELMSKKILVEGGTPTLFTKLIKFFEKNAGDDGLPFLSPSSPVLKLLKAEKSLLKKFDIILNYAKNNKGIRNQLIKFVNAGIPPAELKKLDDFKTFLIKYSNKDKTMLKNTVNKKLDSMIPDSKVREIFKLDFSDYVDNLKPTPPKKIPVKKVKKPIKGDSVLDNISPEELNNAHKDYVFGTGEEFNNFMKKLLEDRKKKIDKKHWGDIESQFTHEIEMLYKKAGEPFPTEIKEQATFAINKLNTMKNIAQKEKIINDTLNKLKDTITVKDSNSILIINRFKEYVLNGGPKGGVGIDEFYRKCIIASSLMAGSNLVLRVSTGLNNFDIDTFKEDAKWNIAKSLIHFVPGLNVISSFQSLIFSICQAFAKLFKDDEMTLKEKGTLSLFKGALELAGMPLEYSPNVQFDTKTKKFMYHHSEYGVLEILGISKNPNSAYIEVNKNPFYLTKFEPTK